MKKLVIVTGNSLHSGGLERILALVANYYSSKSWIVKIVCLLGNTKESFYKLEENIEIILPKKQNKKGKIFNLFSWTKYLKKIFSKENPDVIFAASLKLGAICGLSKPKNTRLVLRELNNPKFRSWIVNQICFKLCKKTDGIIFQTNFEKSCYPKSLQEKGCVIPNPCEVSVKRESANNVFITLGRINNSHKKHDLLIKAWYEVNKFYPNYNLKIFGDGKDKKKNLKLIKKLQLQEVVEINEPQKNIHELICNSYGFILSSSHEGFSNALLEALLIGIPCLTTDWDGSYEIINNNVNGFIVKRNDKDALANKIIFMIENSDKCKNVATKALEDRNKYSLKNILERYSIIIEGHSDE